MTIEYLGPGSRIYDTGVPTILSDHATAERRAGLLLNARDRLAVRCSRLAALGLLLGLGYVWLTRGLS